MVTGNLKKIASIDAQHILNAPTKVSEEDKIVEYYCLSLLCRGNNGDGDHSVSTCCPVSQTCIVFIIYVFGLANNDNLSNPVD
ncbi:unnamed protein product [Brassica oleracea]